MNYNLISYLHMKISKLKKNQPCEDYSLCYQDENKAIAVIADGHGDRRCYRANYGSRLACFTALEILKAQENFENEVLPLLSQTIVQKWREKVIDHYNIHPTDVLSEDPYLVYGSTLCIVVITEDRMVLFNIGDAKCMVRFEDNSFSSLIVNEEINPESLSNSKVKMDIYVSNVLPRCIMLTSDGGGSVKNDESFVDKVEKLYLNNRLKFHRNMLGLVQYFASDDDVSMIWIYKEQEF